MDLAQIAAGTAALLLAAAPVAAHPIDEVVQGAYLTLAPGIVRLELDITPGPEVAPAVLRDLDRDADRHVSDAEARLYADAVLRQCRLTIGGMALAWRIERTNVPPYNRLARQGDTLKIFAVAAVAARAGAHVLEFRNAYQPAKSVVMANIFLQPGDGWQYQVTSQSHSDDGRLFTARVTATRP